MPDAHRWHHHVVATTEGRSRRPGHRYQLTNDRPESAIANFRSIMSCSVGFRSAAAADLARSDLLSVLPAHVTRFRPHIPVRQFEPGTSKASLNACGSLRKRREIFSNSGQNAASGRSPASSVYVSSTDQRIRDNFRCVYCFKLDCASRLRVCTHSYLNRFSKK